MAWDRPSRRRRRRAEQRGALSTTLAKAPTARLRPSATAGPRLRRAMVRPVLPEPSTLRSGASSCSVSPVFRGYLTRWKISQRSISPRRACRAGPAARRAGRRAAQRGTLAPGMAGSGGDAPVPDRSSEVVARIARPIHGEADLDRLLDQIAAARLVLIGEGSYGTHQLHDPRGTLTRRLTAERGFAGVAIAGGWPEAIRVDRYVRGQGDDDSAATALGGFERFPTWMWRNADVAAFAEWLPPPAAQ